jgi:ATP-dependent RNA helicase HelY
LRKETDNLLSQIEGRTNQVAKVFDRICLLLIELEYLSEASGELEVTDAGNTLARIYGERDLLVAQCLRLGVWREADPATLAAIAASLVYEARRDDEDLSPKVPRGNFASIYEQTLSIWQDIEIAAKGYKLPPTNEPDLNFTVATHRWATGARLDAVLGESDMLAGDFIRWMKQIVDLLDQIAQTAQDEVADTARTAIDKIKRGIVAYSYYG